MKKSCFSDAFNFYSGGFECNNRCLRREEYVGQETSRWITTAKGHEKGPTHGSQRNALPLRVCLAHALRSFQALPRPHLLCDVYLDHLGRLTLMKLQFLLSQKQFYVVYSNT